MALIKLLVVSLGLFLVYSLAVAIYNVYFHPLSKFPGPLWRAAFRLPWALSFIKGRMVADMKKLHEEYGEIVRFAPNELSFISPAARRDIYGHASARTFQKDRTSYRRPPEGVDNILTAGDADHSRYRKLLSHAFSDRALKEQETLIGGHVDLLIERLRERSGTSIDMVQWFNYVTFDLVGDLAFGATFGCLDTSSYHPWVALIFQSIRAVATIQVLQRYFPAEWILLSLPTKGMEKRKFHTALVREKVGQRLELQTNRSDFMKYILRHNDEKGMNRRELEANASLLILAGSETTATALSGATYHLLRNPSKLEELVKEIRGKFRSVADMSTEALARCSYLNMALQEAMRMYPPVPVGLPRRVIRDGAVVAGNAVPKGCVVQVPNYSAYNSALNFNDPNAFIPERWSTELATDSSDKDRENRQFDRKDVFEPFSIGPRNCIGKNLAWIEMRLILARVIFEFDMTLLDNNWDPDHQETYVLWQKPPLNVQCKLHIG